MLAVFSATLLILSCSFTSVQATSSNGKNLLELPGVDTGIVFDAGAATQTRLDVAYLSSIARQLELFAASIASLKEEVNVLKEKNADLEITIVPALRQEIAALKEKNVDLESTTVPALRQEIDALKEKNDQLEFHARFVRRQTLFLGEDWVEVSETGKRGAFTVYAMSTGDDQAVLILDVLDDSIWDVPQLKATTHTSYPLYCPRDIEFRMERGKLELRYPIKPNCDKPTNHHTTFEIVVVGPTAL